MNANAKRANWLLGLVGGAGGGVAGYFLYFWLASQGFYAIVLPGGAIGLGCGALWRGKSNALGAVCGLFGAGLGIYTEWHGWNASLGYFLAHLNQLPTISLILIGLGTVFAFWFGRGHERGVWQRVEKAPDRPSDEAN